MWSEIIYNLDSHVIQKTPPWVKDFEKYFTEQIAEGLYQDVQSGRQMIGNFTTPRTVFKSLPRSEKSFWLEYAAYIPDKFRALNLFIRPFEDFCRTCIITDDEIDTLVQMDYVRYCKEIASYKSAKIGDYATEHQRHPAQNSLQSPIEDSSLFDRELNYLIPGQLKKIGYELIRHEEIVEVDMLMIRKLARAIHSKYLHGVKNQRARTLNSPDNFIFNNSGDAVNQHISEFDKLPDEIKYSNIDNAVHIPTKLLSIGYKIRPVKKGFKHLSLSLKEEEIETMAKVEHMRWSWEKRLNGWRYGNKRDNSNKIHPSLTPYENLDESEKDKDRELVKLIPSLLHDIDYEVYPISPSRIQNLSYSIKPQSTIHRLLCETKNLSAEVSKLAFTSPEINEKIISMNKKIEETIREVQGSYAYARYIQKIFLPEDIYIRECFPESFILFKPKNIVSGDFYFFRMRNDQIIFALADCTGHGIPGALISTIGYGYLDQVVNVKKINDPVKILRHLYSGVHRFMRRSIEGHGLQDDMDITLCLLDTRTNLLTHSGVGNLIYHITNGEIKEIKSEYYKDDCNLKQEYHFTSKMIQMQPGDTFYLCSDGFADQLGGKEHKRYQRGRLMDFLQQIHEFPMIEQNDLLYEEIEQWRGENDEEQTDDISIIGIRI